MKELFHSLNKALQQGQRVTLATVVSRKGSLPMSKQARMIVFQDGSSLGTVGGGLLEADVMREALHMLEAQKAPQILSFRLNAEHAEADGLVCGGTAEILLEPFSSEMDVTVLQKTEQTYSASKAAIVVTLLPSDQDAVTLEKPRKLLISEDGMAAGTLGHEVLDARAIELVRPRVGQTCLETVDLPLSSEEGRMIGVERARVFLESILSAPTAYIFGGGHVSLSLSKVLPFIGFEYVVIDDRPEFVTVERFPTAKSVLCHNFDNVFDSLDVSAHASYLIIVTRGHSSDFVVLEQALRRPAKYIGMIGSRRKVRLLLDGLQQQGVPVERLGQVHAPIGLEIHADTPEEIAISIAAELIKVRRDDT